MPSSKSNLFPTVWFSISGDSVGLQEQHVAQAPNVSTTTKDNITVMQHFVKVSIGGSMRKFMKKTYGNGKKAHQPLVVWACEVFEELAQKKNSAFDTAVALRQPSERKAILEAAGCESKFWNPGKYSRLATQRAALVRQLCDGFDKLLEDQIITTVLGRAIGDASGMKMKATATGFSASFQGSKQVVEQSFRSFADCVDWLLAMLVAEKEGMGCRVVVR